jgi:hypothetical protein
VRRPLIVASIAAVCVLAAAISALGVRSGSASTSMSNACGLERWTVKTLQDRPRLLPARSTTVAHLTSLPRPRVVPATRLPFERQIYSVRAAVTLVRLEADQDLHLVLRSGGAQMIAEAPNAPTCTVAATPYRKRQMASARRLVRVCPRALVVGVAFWDFFHGQTGVAPNAIELHPILGFSCLPKPKPELFGGLASSRSG